MRIIRIICGDGDEELIHTNKAIDKDILREYFNKHSGDLEMALDDYLGEHYWDWEHVITNTIIL